jgi:hypothetical protein
MAKYTINLYNQSTFTKSYVVFNKLPQLNTSGSDPQIFANAWVSLPNVANNGTETLSTSDSVYAYYGTAPQQLAPGVMVTQGGATPVNTATQDSVTFIGAEPGAFSSVTSGAADAGAFQIIANSDFDPSAGYVFGMAKMTPVGMPVPVATFTAMPSDTFNVIPVVTFYIAEGNYTPGTIINVKEASTKAATIDFTGRQQTTATVTQNSDGTFTVSYSE